MNWTEFTRQQWGEHWGLCRNTTGNRARYDRCVSNTEFQSAQAAYRRAHTADSLRDSFTQQRDGELTAVLFEVLEQIHAHLKNGDNCPAIMETLISAAINKARAA